MAKHLNSFYRIFTPCKSAQFFNPMISKEFAALKRKEKEGKLGTTASGDPYIAEHYQTERMQAEGWVGETDKDGIFETDGTSNEDKEVAKTVLRSLRCFSGIGGWSPLNDDKDESKQWAEKQVELITKFYEKSLDKNSPRDIIEELRKELTNEFTVAAKTNKWAELKAEIEASKPKSQ